jgi:hypothetical protein
MITEQNLSFFSILLGLPLFLVRRFWEQSRAELAAKLMLKGCLLNSLIMVASAPRLLEMIGEYVPALYVAFNAAFASLDDSGERAVEELYRNMAPCGFSQEILLRRPPGLVVSRVGEVEHNDWTRRTRCGHSANRPGTQSHLRKFGEPAAHLPPRNAGSASVHIHWFIRPLERRKIDDYKFAEKRTRSELLGFEKRA